MVAFSGKSGVGVDAIVGIRNQVLAVGKLVRKESKRDWDYLGPDAGIYNPAHEIIVGERNQATSKSRALTIREVTTRADR